MNINEGYPTRFVPFLLTNNANVHILTYVTLRRFSEELLSIRLQDSSSFRFLNLTLKHEHKRGHKLEAGNGQISKKLCIIIYMYLIMRHNRFHKMQLMIKQMATRGHYQLPIPRPSEIFKTQVKIIHFDLLFRRF